MKSDNTAAKQQQGKKSKANANARIADIYSLNCKKINKKKCSAILSKKYQRKNNNSSSNTNNSATPPTTMASSTIIIQKCEKNREPHGAYLCDACSSRMLGLVIKQSTIPGANYGLFATRNFKKGEFIDWYEGNVIKSKRQMDLLEKRGLATYFMESRNGDIIDSIATDSCFCRFANEAVFKKDFNCEFVNCGPREVGMVALRDIEASEDNHVELFVYYGSDYGRENYEEAK